MSKVLFRRSYSDEDLWVEIEEDIRNIVNTQKYKDLPIHEYGFKDGIFKITITWKDYE